MEQWVVKFQGCIISWIIPLTYFDDIWLRNWMTINMNIWDKAWDGDQHFKNMIKGWDGDALEEAEKNREILADINKR